MPQQYRYLPPISLISTNAAFAVVEMIDPGCRVTGPALPSLISRSVAVTPVTLVGLGNQ